ncbi:MAG: hypothetical protein AAF160_00945 [Pseudomonadota bacterium]
MRALFLRPSFRELRAFCAVDKGAITLDWLTLLAGLLVVTSAVLFAVGGDVSSLARAIGVETSEELADSNTLWGAKSARPSVIKSENEPLRRYDPDRPEMSADTLSTATLSAAVDRPLDIGATGAFEPAIAEPDAAEPAPTPVATLQTTEILPTTEAIAVETDAPRPDCVLEEPVAEDDASPWVSGILQDEVRCREKTYGRKAEPKRTGELPKPTLAVPTLPTADLTLEDSAVAVGGAVDAASCEDDLAEDNAAATTWLGGALAERLACPEATDVAD